MVRSTMFRILLVALFAGASLAYGAEEQDILQIEGLHAGEMLDVVVMIDARQQDGVNPVVCRDGGRKDPRGQWTIQHTGASPLVIPLGNLFASDACNSEIVVFSEKHKMHIEKVQWTDSSGDVRVIQLEPRIKVPVNLWTVNDEHEEQARADLALAQKLYTENRVGVEFTPVFRRVSPRLTAYIADRKCGAVSTVREQGESYIPGELNVYYVEGYTGADRSSSGRNCAIERTLLACPPPEQWTKIPRVDGNFTIVTAGPTTPPFTLAHELGHAFGLRPSACHGHVDNLRLPSGRLAFHLENIMHPGPFEAGKRKILTLGQVFRMNTQQDPWGGTMLIANGLRPIEDGRKCPPNAWTDQCPLLSTHWFVVPISE